MPPGPVTATAAVATRMAIVAAGRRLRAAGLIAATEGNLSIRLDAGWLLATPTARRKDELEPADLAVVPLDASTAAPGGESGPQPSSDIAIHRAIYAARPDVGAVVHAHLPAAMALTLAGQVPDPATLPETAMLLPLLPLVPFGTPGSSALATDVAAALRGAPGAQPGAVLLERHGAVGVGTTIDQAVDRLELVEVLCRSWRDALLIKAVAAGGTAAILPPRCREPAPARGRSRRQP